MNTKVATVITVELGILIVLLAWLAFSNFSRVKQRTLPEGQEQADGSFATVTALPANMRYSTADYFTDQQRQQLVAQQQPQTLQYGTMQYDQQGAPAPYTSADVDDSDTGTSPYYGGVYPQPLTSPDSIGWPYDPVLAFPPTNGIIVISNGQAFVRRGASRFAQRPMMFVHRRLPGSGGAQFQPPVRGFHLQPRSGAVIPRHTANPHASRPTPSLRPR